jgi:hypothetical protein
MTALGLLPCPAGARHRFGGGNAARCLPLRPYRKAAQFYALYVRVPVVPETQAAEFIRFPKNLPSRVIDDSPGEFVGN